MRVMYTNNFDDYVPNVSSQNGNYPGINVQDSRLAKVWRTTALTSQTITVDSGSGNTLQPTFAALLNTNLTTGGTYKIQGSSSSGFTSSTEANLTRIDANFVGAFITLSAKRHWRFLIKDTGSTDSYMKVGRAWIGTYTDLTQTVSQEFPEEYIDSSLYAISYTGQLYGDAGIVRRAYNLKFPYVSTTQKSTMELFLDTVKKFKPFVTVFKSTAMAKVKPLYGFKSKDHAFRHKYNYRWECSLQLEEAK